METAASIHPLPRTRASCPQRAGLAPATPGGPGLTSGWLGSRLTPCPPWTSLGPWEEAAPPTHLPFSPAAPTGAEGGRRVSRGNLVPGVLLAPLGGLPHGTSLPGDSPTLPLPSTARGCDVSPNPPFPPEPHPSPDAPPQRPERSGARCVHPSIHTPLKSPPLFLPVTKSRCEASAGRGQGGNPSVLASSTSSSDSSELLRWGQGVVVAGLGLGS